MFNTFKSIASSKHVLGNITIEEFLGMIKNGYNKTIVNKARHFLQLGYKDDYDEIKKKKIATVCLNFLFKKNRSNDSILRSTGYLYIDIDNRTDISLDNNFIHASWKSLSGNGRGILIKVEGINIGNFKYNYKLLSNEIEIESDNNAAKPTQVTVISYDKDIFINEDSLVWKAKEEVPHYSEKDNKYNIVNNVLGHYDSINIRHDNLEEFLLTIDFGDHDIYDYGESVYLSKIYTRFNIPEGRRYVTLNGQAYQFRALNKASTEEQLASFLFTQNRFRCKPPLADDEVIKILNNICAIPLEDLKPIPNWRRRYFFDPDSYISTKSKQRMVITEVNRRRTMDSINAIDEAIKNWDFEKHGKITNNKLVSVSGKSRNTVDKYKKFFKDEIKNLNEHFKKQEDTLPDKEVPNPKGRSP